MRKIAIILLALLLILSMISCNRVSQKQVEKMIEDAVEEALEEQESDEKDEDDQDMDDEVDMDEEAQEDDADEQLSDGESFAIEADGATYNYIGEKIPEDFPIDQVPLYESADAEVVGAIRASSGDAVTFSVGIGTDNDPKDVAQDVMDALKKIYSNSDIQEISMGEYAMFIVDGKDWAISINVIEGDEEGYETLVAYTVMTGN